MQENFKELHKELDTLKSSGFSVSEIKKDISAMEEEKEQILRRIDRLKKKAEGIPGTNNLMSITQSLRRETEKETKISTQKQEQKTVRDEIVCARRCEHTPRDKRSSFLFIKKRIYKERQCLVYGLVPSRR